MVPLNFSLSKITGDLNSKVIEKVIQNTKPVMLKDKSTLQDVLARETHLGDLILFANDAPNFI